MNVTTGKEDSVGEEVFKEGLENRFSHQVVNNRRSYAHVTQNFSDGDLVCGASLSYSNIINYRVLEEDLVRFDKAYVERVVNPGSTYNMQSSFEVVGFFSVKVTSIGANLCLLEDNEEGFLEAIISEGIVWLGRWFAEVRKWKYEDVDLERVTWLRCYGIPCHACVFSFFGFHCRDLYL